MAVLVVMSVVPPMSSTMVTRYVEPHIHCVCTVAFKVFVRVTRVRREGPRILWRLILVSGLHLFRLLPRSHILSGWDDQRAQRCLFQQRRVAFRIFIHGGAVQGSSPAVQRSNCSLADGQWLGLVWFPSMVAGAGGFFLVSN
uniref:Putative secreted protein n=1 Tax=Ixodes ricinus TaxID=34613 RepID=A0A6B0UTI9_IXORI